MAKLVVISRGGERRVVEKRAGFSVMEIVRSQGFDELLALCSGCCSCATCHVYVDPAFKGALPPMTDDENDLLEGSDNRTEHSCLSCQLSFSDALDGLTVRIAPDV